MLGYVDHVIVLVKSYLLYLYFYVFGIEVYKMFLIHVKFSFQLVRRVAAVSETNSPCLFNC
jgi:hypothetical protein